MVQLVRAIVGVASDVLRLGVLFLHSSSAIRAENLLLRVEEQGGPTTYSAGTA